MQSFSSEQKRRLLSNPNVLKITNNHVVYTSDFKVQAVELNLKGHLPEQIFIDHGMDPSFFKDDYCRSCLKRWRKTYHSKGRYSLKEENRGRTRLESKRTNLDHYSVEDLKAIILVQAEMIQAIKKKKTLVKKS